jgi:putative lipase involved disintegration of autophagic bodies
VLYRIPVKCALPVKVCSLSAHFEQNAHLSGIATVVPDDVFDSYLFSTCSSGVTYNWYTV